MHVGFETVLSLSRQLSVRCPIAPQAFVDTEFCNIMNVTAYFNEETGFRNYTEEEVCPQP